MKTAKPLTTGRPALRVIEGAQSVQVFEPSFAPTIFRPSERSEPFTFRISEQMREFMSSPEVRSFNFAQMVSLIVQTAIVERDLTGWDAAPAHLDQIAADVCVSRELSPADAAYLRALRSPQALHEASPTDRERCTIPLPGRLIAQIDESTIFSALQVARIQRAYSWEIASLLAGQSMLEWAMISTLHSQRDV